MNPPTPRGYESVKTPVALFLDYARAGELLSLSWDQHEARLVAASLTEVNRDARAIATAALSGSRSTSEIDGRLAPFVAAVRRFLAGPGE